MTVVDDEPAKLVGIDDSWPVSPFDSGCFAPRWTLKNWIIALVIVAATIAAILGLIAWVPGAFASAPGGCGGG